jgi:antitoxin (DNA-binding transcriptional repressor) of toxin-antitoxin stability system
MRVPANVLAEIQAGAKFTLRKQGNAIAATLPITALRSWLNMTPYTRRKTATRGDKRRAQGGLDKISIQCTGNAAPP